MTFDSMVRIMLRTYRIDYEEGYLYIVRTQHEKDGEVSTT